MSYKTFVRGQYHRSTVAMSSAKKPIEALKKIKNIFVEADILV